MKNTKQLGRLIKRVELIIDKIYGKFELRLVQITLLSLVGLNLIAISQLGLDVWWGNGRFLFSINLMMLAMSVFISFASLIIFGYFIYFLKEWLENKASLQLLLLGKRMS